MNKILLLLASAALLCGQATNVFVSRITHQQAVISFTPPSSAACAITATDNSGRNVTVWDVNAINTGSTSDLTRADTLNAGGRTITIGHQGVITGTDGNIYSTSLQAATSHTATICGTSVTFTTAQIPAGVTNPEPARYSNASTSFGGLAWPTMQWAASTYTYVDPMTGAALSVGPQVGVASVVSTAQTFLTQNSASGWVNPANILNASGGVSLAVSTNSNPLYVSINSTTYINGSASANSVLLGLTSSNFIGDTVNGVRINLWGHGSPVQVCPSFDGGQTCFAANQTITLNPTTNGSVSFPSTASAVPGMYPDWAPTKYPHHNWVMPINATVSTSGTTVTISGFSPGDGTMGSGIMPLDYPIGAPVLINNVLYSVASVQSNTSFTLTSSAGAQTSVAMVGANFGFVITVPSGVASISATYDLTYTATPGFWAADGSTDQFSPNTITCTHDANHNPVSSYTMRLAILPYASIGEVLFGLVVGTGEMRMLGLPITGFGNGFGVDSYPDFGINPWDNTTGSLFYGHVFDINGNHTLANFNYRGDCGLYNPGPLPDNGVYYSVITNSITGTTCLSGEQVWGNLCASILTSTDLNTLTMAADGGSGSPFGKGAFCGNPKMVTVMGGTIALSYTCQQDGIMLFVYIDITAGTVTSIADSMFGTARYLGVHSQGGLQDANHHLVTANPLGSRGNKGPFAGPYYVPVTGLCSTACYGGSPTFSGTTSFNSSFTSGTYMGHANTIALQTSGEPCSQYGLGTVNVAGTAVTWVSGAQFPYALPGIMVNGVKYAMTYIDGTHGTLGTNLGTLTGATSNINYLEVSGFTCPWSSMQAMLSAAQVGDVFGDLSQCNGACSEELQLLSKTVTNVNLITWIFLRGANSTAPTSFSNGWNLSPYPTASCTSAFWWFNNNSTALYPEYCPSVYGFSHLDTGIITPNYLINGGSAIKNGLANSPTGALTPNAGLLAFGTWLGLSPSTSWPGNGSVEEYPSCRALALTLQYVCLDARAYQGGTANNPGYGTTTLNNMVMGTATAADSSTIYTIYNSSITNNYKTNPFEAYSGHYIFKDISGVGSVMNSSKPWQYCYPLVNGECVTGSLTSAGLTYFYQPGIITSTSGYTNSMEATVPSIFPASPVGTWRVQEDTANPFANNFKRVTTCGSAPSRDYTYTNWRSEVSATWGLCILQMADGVAPVAFMVKMPAWNGYGQKRGDGYHPFTVNLPAGAAYAEIRFGYTQNGAPTNLYCTNRLDTCATSASATVSNPFNFIGGDGHSGTACTSGCSITIPTLPNRVLWWQEYRSPDNATWTPGVMHVN